LRAASQQVSESASQCDIASTNSRVRTRHFRDLIAWQKSMVLVKNVYLLTDKFPATERFGLTSQMRRSSVSVPSNIAEGHGRLTDKGLRVFLAQARGSLFELETQLLLSSELGFSDKAEADRLVADCNEVARILNGLIKVLEAE
jgi:four helix bundle protein